MLIGDLIDVTRNTLHNDSICTYQYAWKIHWTDDNPVEKLKIYIRNQLQRCGSVSVEMQRTSTTYHILEFHVNWHQWSRLSGRLIIFSSLCLSIHSEVILFELLNGFLARYFSRHQSVAICPIVDTIISRKCLNDFNTTFLLTFWIGFKPKVLLRKMSTTQFAFLFVCI